LFCQTYEYWQRITFARQIAITGAASGMGLATAKLLASRGAYISLADINEEAMKAAVKSLPNSDKHMHTVVDVRSSESVNNWIQSTVMAMGKLDGAVNMAGVITSATPVAEETDENWDFNFAVNTRGVFFCIRAQLKAMTAGGSIVSFPWSECEGISPNGTITGVCGQCFWTNGGAWRFCILRQQSSCYWINKNCRKGEPTHKS
jgi:NAD(P)-dependent dehydrogenase (short-subunit alcohol dehydrogenase family)